MIDTDPMTDAAASPGRPCAALMRRLYAGKLWHSTTMAALRSIWHDGVINPNNQKQYPDSHSQSAASYGRHLGAVSLFDFTTLAQVNVRTYRRDSIGILIRDLPAGVLIQVQLALLDRQALLLAAEIYAGDERLAPLPEEVRKGRGVIPHVEALHCGPIPSTTFGTFIAVGHSNEIGETLWQEVPIGPTAADTLAEIGKNWQVEHDRLAEERYARGERNWADILRASPFTGS